MKAEKRGKKNDCKVYDLSNQNGKCSLDRKYWGEDKFGGLNQECGFNFEMLFRYPRGRSGAGS